MEAVSILHDELLCSEKPLSGAVISELPSDLVESQVQVTVRSDMFRCKDRSCLLVSGRYSEIPAISVGKAEKLVGLEVLPSAAFPPDLGALELMHHNFLGYLIYLISDDGFKVIKDTSTEMSVTPGSGPEVAHQTSSNG